MVSHGSQFGSLSPFSRASTRPSEPLTGVRKLRGEFFHYFVADFVAAAANAGSKRGDHILRAGAEFHSHAAECFLGDALRCAAPSGVNCSHRVLLGISKQDGNAVGGLDGQQNAGFTRDQGVTFGGLCALRKCGGAHDVNDIGMNLAQPSDAHFAGTECSVEIPAIFQDAFA